MPSLTTNYSLNKPLVNNATDQDLWGGYLNDNMDTIDSTLKTSRDWIKRTVTAADSLVAGDRCKIILCNATTAAFTFTLLAAATAGDGFPVIIKKTDATSNAVTIDGSGSETIDAALTYALSSQNDSVLIVCDGTNWQVAAYKTAIGAGGEAQASTTVSGIIEIATNAEAVTGTDTDRAVTPAGVAAAMAAYAAASPPTTLPSVTNAATGKVVIGDVTIQWGTGSASAGGTSVTFGTAFSGTPYYVGYMLMSGSEVGIITTSLTSSGFTADTASGGSGSIKWMAIGPT